MSYCKRRDIAHLEGRSCQNMIPGKTILAEHHGETHSGQTEPGTAPPKLAVMCKKDYGVRIGPCSSSRPAERQFFSLDTQYHPITAKMLVERRFTGF